MRSLFCFFAILFVSTRGVIAQQQQQDAKVASIDEEAPSADQSRRRLWSIWSVLQFIHDGRPCPPLNPHCKVEREELSDEEASYYEYNSNTGGSRSWFGGGGSSSSGGSVNTGDGSSESQNLANGEYQDRQTANRNNLGGQSSSMGWWMFMTVGSVVAALFAVTMGQRKNPIVPFGEGHQLAGAVARHNSSLAASLGGTAAGPNSAPKADVEMQSVEVKRGYKMQVGDDGAIEMTPGYQIS